MQLGVSSYSYSRLVRNGTLKQHEVIAAAKEAGFQAIEFSTIAVPKGQTLAEYADVLRQEARQVGIPIANYTIGADFLNGSNGNLEAEIKRVKAEVDIAEILGAPGMRHDATGGFPAGHTGPAGFDNALPRLIEGCRAVTEYAAGKGIRTMVENHGFFCQDSARVEKLINGVAHPNFGVLADIGNFLCVDENSGEAIGRLARHIFHTHAKDFHIKSGDGFNPGEGWFMSRGGNFLRGAIIGHGDVPLLQALRALKRSGFNGVLSIEFEGMEDVKESLRIGLANLRRLVETA